MLVFSVGRLSKNVHGSSVLNLCRTGRQFRKRSMEPFCVRFLQGTDVAVHIRENQLGRLWGSVHAAAGREVRLWLVVWLFREACRSSLWADRSQVVSAAFADAVS